jgi:hypothetical protein
MAAIETDGCRGLVMVGITTVGLSGPYVIEVA